MEQGTMRVRRVDVCIILSFDAPTGRCTHEYLNFIVLCYVWVPPEVLIAMR